MEDPLMPARPTVSKVDLKLIGASYQLLLGVGSASRSQEEQNLFAQRGCCKRQGKYVYIGHDISGSPASIDIGMCRTYCGGPQRMKSYISGVLGFSRQSSMLEFLKTKKLQDRFTESQPSNGADRSCPLDYHCEPSSVRVENVLLLAGIRQVEVIEGCHCSPSPAECLRLPSLKTFFPDSPLEQTVDVGKCSSPPHSEDGLFCVPTRFDPVLLKSPNGNDVVRTLESCELRQSCYRVSHREYYFEVLLNSAGERMERLKEIDVGRCLGGCTSGNHCLLRDPQVPDKCLVLAEGVSSHCTPHQYETHTFRSRTGQLRTVFSIQACRCEA
ncbi:uncharacterized protein LOC129330258 [Eublepharis macularius]|uniref:Uncharacterized protein LOC129330258 n=1 Tax=Eublepharis macularius TaxID=481883 RepID=A0AA97JF23_EUBMA|nr:uncharacterized protein LOC129330258 [Eublepharis macularius]